MRLIARGTLKQYYQDHPETETGLKIWVQKISRAKWDGPQEILQTFSQARPIGDGGVIFNINNNDYRLIAQVNYDRKAVYVCFIGSHAEYDKIDPRTVWNY